MVDQTEYGDGWELRCADCLGKADGMPSLDSCSHVITDPPYGHEAHHRQRSLRNAQHGHVRLEPSLPFDEIGAGDLDRWSAAIARVSEGWAVVFCQGEHLGDWRRAIEANGGTWKRAGIWDKAGSEAPQITGDRPGQAFEGLAIAWCGDGRSRWNGGGRAGRWRFPNAWMAERVTRASGHPTQKPLALMEALVRDFTDPGELICDPFAGSATTGVAAIRLGRRFVGWEKDPAFFATAARRLRAAKPQGDLFRREGIDGKPLRLPGLD